MTEYLLRSVDLDKLGCSITFINHPKYFEQAKKDALLIAYAKDLLNQVIEDHAQYMCGCKHPACKNCERDSVRAALINQVIGAE